MSYAQHLALVLVLSLGGAVNMYGDLDTFMCSNARPLCFGLLLQVMFSACRSLERVHCMLRKACWSLALRLLRWRRHSAMASSSAWEAVQTECMCVCRL